MRTHARSSHAPAGRHSLTRWTPTVSWIVIALFAGCLCPAATAAEDLAPTLPEQPATVEAAYMGLSSGPLATARPADLPTGQVLRAGEVALEETEIAAQIGQAEEGIRGHLEANAFFILEQMAVQLLLEAEAGAWAETAAEQPEDALVAAYLDSVAEGVEVREDEARAIYDANRDVFGEETYEQVAEELREFILSQKRQQAIGRLLGTLAERTVVELDSAWVAAQALTALNNEVDKARRSGKPSLVDFGSDGCAACEMMKPVLAELAAELAATCNVITAQVGDEPILAARYGVQSIPVQIIFDAEGKPRFRHTGYISKEQLLAQLAVVGVVSGQDQ